jgi:hypothetical protein
VQLKLALLNVLANRPGGRATLDEVRRELEVFIGGGAQQTEQLKRFSTIGDIDIFQSGLVISDDDGYQITDAGRSLLLSLKSQTSLEAFAAPASQSLRSIHDLVGIHERLKRPSPLSKLFTFITTKKLSMFERWRRHFTPAVSNPKAGPAVSGVGSAAFAFLSLVAVLSCIGAAIALGQIKSLKSDIAMLHRELMPLRERLGKLEQSEKAKRDLDQQEEAQKRSDTENNKAGAETRPDQTALNLSREEVQLIRDYIKPSPAGGIAAPEINVGDPIDGAMIPLPSPLTEKVPKLIGGRFTTRNGAIIISTKNSRRADAVLPPN